MMSDSPTITSVVSRISTPHSPWNLRKLAREDLDFRDAVSQNLPGATRKLELKIFAEALMTGEAWLEITYINRSDSSTSLSDAIYFALEGISGKRSILAVERSLARNIIDAMLGRTSIDKDFSSGEEGALFFAVDRAGGDWLELGGAAFTLNGMLVDKEQCSDFLNAPPKWSIGAKLTVDNTVGHLQLLFVAAPAFNATFATRLPAAPSLGVALDWPVRFVLQIGAARLDLDTINKLDKGDLIIADSLGFPFEKAADISVVLRCGEVIKKARWLDRTTLMLLEQRWEKKMTTDTRVSEIPARLDNPSEKEATGLEVDVRVEIADVKMSVDKALNLIPGTVIRLDKPVGTEVSLRVGEKTIAKGELVDHNGRLAVEITEIS